jgi:diacylglycerol kinase family enzyme
MKDTLGPLAYPVGALLAGVRERGWVLEVTVDGTVVAPGDATGGALGGQSPPSVLMVGVGNGRSIGGGTELFPTAVPDDGLADVVVVRATGPAARIAFGAALRKGTHLGRDDVAHVRGREVRIAGDAVRHNADGEVSDEVTERSYRLVPGAWSLVVPA